jgi:succinate dehydrogenase / fumarate reductase flavoprotein subunit
MEGTENAYQIHRELGEIMTDNVTVVRYNDKLEETLTKITELRDRFTLISATDTARWSNQGS